jgi:hypothetical protein
VNDERRIVGIGYNGLPNGVHDALVNWHQTDPNSPLFKNFYGQWDDVEPIGLLGFNGCTMQIYV